MPDGQDMMMFTQQETLFVALPDNFVTGEAERSSKMCPLNV